MNSYEHVERFVKLVGQLKGLHKEISVLVKKSPNDGVNNFKISLINKVIQLGNDVLGEKYRPFSEFEVFDKDDIPSNSDVAMVLTQYLEEAERFRSDNILYDDYKWKYSINGEVSDIETSPPLKISKK